MSHCRFCNTTSPANSSKTTGGEECAIWRCWRCGLSVLFGKSWSVSAFHVPSVPVFIFLSVAYNIEPFSMKWSTQIPTRMWVCCFGVFKSICIDNSSKAVMLLFPPTIDRYWYQTLLMALIRIRSLQPLPCCSWSSLTCILLSAMYLSSSRRHFMANGWYVEVTTVQFACSTNVAAKCSSVCSTVTVRDRYSRFSVALLLTALIDYLFCSSSGDTRSNCCG